jgi:acetoin utilization deacetylase AcuC-like enzyme
MLKVAFAPIYRLELPEGHRFPMEKYDLLPEQLLYEGTLEEANFFQPKPIDEQYILWTHEDSYWHKLRDLTLTAKEIRAIGFPINAHFITRTRTISSGTLQCAQFALTHGCALNIAGGTHHAFTYKGEGFCLLNDNAIASNYLLNNSLAKKILIVDLDVHQGNGTAQIFQQDMRVFTFSMHCEKNYPLVKEKSDLDIGLPDGIEDKQYLAILKETLPKLIDEVQPDFMFYQSGVDILASDKLGRLNVSMEGCKQRDRFVFEMAKKNKIPIVASMGGGYSERIAHIVEAHANTYRMAQDVFF